MARPKKIIEIPTVEEALREAVAIQASDYDQKQEAKERLAYLHELYQTLKDENIRSIGDLENKIALLQ